MEERFKVKTKPYAALTIGIVFAICSFILTFTYSRSHFGWSHSVLESDIWLADPFRTLWLSVGPSRGEDFLLRRGVYN